MIMESIIHEASDVDVDAELKTIDCQLKKVSRKIIELNKLKENLIKRRETLNDLSLARRSRQLGDDSKWNSQDFSWYCKVLELLNDTFRLASFRPYQLSAINATLSKKDVILIMPTGGGKSLCFQLPALVNKGFTLVISPMLSLMEDQVINLKSKSINAEMFSSHNTTQENSKILQMMVDPKSNMKLLYATPEKLAKSKRFMNKLQKSYEMDLLSRIAVDEVHCCSQWGHDFRPDYQYLMVLKGMFDNVPFIGLTATATSKVILDVQKMLSIPDCIVFKSSFNRPNLFYEVRPKPCVQKECLDQLEELLKHKFKGQSGIIYTTTIKDCEDLRRELRDRNCRVNGYHAQLDAELRSKIHKKWLSGEYQAIIATIAFGLGIDKPDVRFILHHSLSKSMENFYQESGRAGRDGKNATCIMFYRLADIFRLSTMVFTQKTGLQNLYSIVDYCLNPNECRRKMIASHFNETWESTDCNQMCDHCRDNTAAKKMVNITKHCNSIYELINQAVSSSVKLTAHMLLDCWYCKSSAKVKCTNITAPKFSLQVAESILAYLLINDYLKEDFHYTAYSTISYIKEGAKSHLVNEGHEIQMPIRGKHEYSSTIMEETEVSECKKNNASSGNVNSEVIKKKRKYDTLLENSNYEV